MATGSDVLGETYKCVDARNQRGRLEALLRVMRRKEALLSDDTETEDQTGAQYLEAKHSRSCCM